MDVVNACCTSASLHVCNGPTCLGFRATNTLHNYPNCPGYAIVRWPSLNWIFILSHSNWLSHAVTAVSWSRLRLWTCLPWFLVLFYLWQFNKPCSSITLWIAKIDGGLNRFSLYHLYVLLCLCRLFSVSCSYQNQCHIFSVTNAHDCFRRGTKDHDFWTKQGISGPKPLPFLGSFREVFKSRVSSYISILLVFSTSCYLITLSLATLHVYRHKTSTVCSPSDANACIAKALLFIYHDWHLRYARVLQNFTISDRPLVEKYGKIFG